MPKILTGKLYDCAREREYLVEVEFTSASVVIRYPEGYPTPKEIHIYPDQEVDYMIAEVDENYTYIDVVEENAHAKG